MTHQLVQQLDGLNVRLFVLNSPVQDWIQAVERRLLGMAEKSLRRRGCCLPMDGVFQKRGSQAIHFFF